MHNAMNVNLSSIPETMLIPLWAKAAESTTTNPIISDFYAIDILNKLNYDFTRFNKAWMTQVGVAVRTSLLDNGVKAFLDKNPSSIVINLGAGLDTRSKRIKSSNLFCWYDLDVPEAIEMRKAFFSEDEKHHFIAKSMFDYSWMEEIKTAIHPVLIVAEGLFMYFSEPELRELLNHMIHKFSGAEILVEITPSILVGNSNRHESVKMIKNAPQFKWGINNTREMASWHKNLHYLGEQNYFDFHKSRWRWLRWPALFSSFRKRFNAKIVHFKIGKQL